MGTKIKRKGGNNPYREKSDVQPQGESEFVTQDDLNTALTPIQQGMTTIVDTVKALQESLKGSEKTDAQHQEIVERQVEDADKVNSRKKAVIPVFDNKNAVGDEQMFLKGFTPNMSRYEAKTAIQDVLTMQPETETLKEYQVWSDRIKFQCELLGKRPIDLMIYPQYEDFLQKTGIDKTLNLAGAATNFIPEGWSMETLAYYYQALKLGMAFEEFTMPNSPYTYPIIGRPTAHYATRANSQRGTAADEFPLSADADEGAVTFTARTISVRVDLEEEYVEDSAMAMEALVSQLIPYEMARAVESAIINGDTNGTHQDANFQSATSPVEKAWDGLRRIALERSATLDIEAGSATYGYDDFSRLVEEGGIYTVFPDDNCWVMPNAAYTKATRFTQLETFDKFPQSTNITGAIGQILGRDVIVSPEYPQVLSADGTNTAANNTQTGFTLFNKMQFKIGNRRMERVRMHFDDVTGAYYVVATRRLDFQAMENRRAGYTPAVSAINITTAS